ncbi:MAG: M67 family metallopeptidase [Gemmatimonadales bacterium]
MTLALESRHLESIRRRAEAAYPEEACGLIGGLWEGETGGDRKTGVTLVPLLNARRDSRRNRYRIDPESVRRAQERLDRDGLEIVGVYHSHPDHPPKPSAYDREHGWPRLSYVIVEVRRGRAGVPRSWVLRDDRTGFVEEPVTMEGKIVWQSPF